MDDLVPYKTVRISIHAPREGSDNFFGGFDCVLFNFNPRSPGGERPVIAATPVMPREISIHAPREGSDSETAQRHRYVL